MAVTRAETSAFLIWVLLIIIVAVVFDGGLAIGLVMALAGIAIALLAVWRRRSSR